MKLRAVEPSVSFPELEVKRLDTWDKLGIFERSISERAGAPRFVFYDGPPFATGLPHYGHLVGSVIKDIIPRYFTMRGMQVERRWGWDCHGLPVENEAQKELQLADARAVMDVGMETFNQTCRSLVLRYTAEWKRTIRRLGRWVDHEHGYRTMDRDFMESVWWVFRTLWDQGRIYEGFRVQPVSTALGTPLSNFEVALGPQEKDPVTKKEGHKRRQDPSITVRFALESEDASLWAWTTTPWTLPSNLALAVHPDLDYIQFRLLESGEVAYANPTCLARYRERGRIGDYEVLKTVQGRALEGLTYRPLLPFFAEYALPNAQGQRAFRVVLSDHATLDSGTGIVHIAPAFGEDDFAIGQREGLPMVNPVSLTGIFDASIPDWEGRHVKEADKDIMTKLKELGVLVDRDTIVHATPHCYRTEEPLIYMALSTWFMAVENMRERLVALNDQVHWVPEAIGSGRFGNWLANARDWNLARSRFWGTPLPIWRCDLDPSDMLCVGSVAELEQWAGLAPGTVGDLHREHVDSITFPSQKTPGGTMVRTSEVFDCWFESGSMPFAQNHYPFENKEYVEAGHPGDFIAEGVDQTRGWFYTLTVLSAALRDRPAFKNVIVNGIVLAEDGTKMSKSKRNFTDPNEVLEKFGADALRIYLIDSPVVNAKDIRFADAGVQEKIRTVLLPLWNAYSFLTRYAEVDGWQPDGVAPDPAVHELDGWILARMQTLIGLVRQHMDEYRLYLVVPALLEFIDDLTNWYIRLSRRRFWRGGSSEDRDKHNAYRTLHHVLLTLSRVLAPFLPFVADEMYENLAVGQGKDSVHLEDYPEADASLHNPALERRMELARKAVSIGRSLRVAQDVRIRQPLASMTVAVAQPEDRAAIEAARELVLGELNIKRLEWAESEAALVSFAARPNLKVLGPAFGKRLGDIKREVAALTSEQCAQILQGTDRTSPEVEGLVYTTDNLLIDRQSREGLVVGTDGGVTVALDLHLTPELEREGLAREVINRVQNTRKDLDLALDDRIQVELSASGELALAVADHWEMIAGEVLAGHPCPPLDGPVEQAFELEVLGHPLRLAVHKAR
ncbi:MAG TPA: isoleucine--tRNA ligase [Planctomycetota bacterium]|nr:isoleucine--tRNA ligase [Planctomycetota bacterium]